MKKDKPWFKIFDQVPKHPVYIRDTDFDFRLKRALDCTCGTTYTFFCQQDDVPEYYTHITMQCPKCNALIQIEFPVN